MIVDCSYHTIRLFYYITQVNYIYITVECPTGTFHSSKEQCEPCNYGTYQDVSGQTSCKPCPDSFSTAIVGSQSISLCTGMMIEKL